MLPLPSRPRRCDDAPALNAEQEPPPLGSWARVYALVALVAVVVMLLLYALTAAYSVPLPAGR
jgi:predicted secreted protein